MSPRPRPPRPLPPASRCQDGVDLGGNQGHAQAPPGRKININTATKEELDVLPGIGPVKAQAIIDGRPFKTIEDIKNVRGIKDGEFSKIQDLITVN